MRLQQRADACGLCAQLRPLLHYYCQLPGVQSPAALLQLRLDASRRSARRRGLTFITQDVTGPPGQGWRGGPFCKSRTSTAWECKRRQTRSGFRRVLSPPPRRSKRTFRVDSVTTTEKTTPNPAEPNPYLYERDPARTVHSVGRVVEHSVPIQRPQPDIGEEKKGDYSQPDELQQPLLFPPHGYRTRRADQRRCRVASPEPPELRSGKNFHSDRGTDAGAVTLRCSRDSCR